MSSLVTLIFILVGLLLSAVGFEFINAACPYHVGPILGWAGISLSAMAAIRQFRESRPHVRFFSDTSWTRRGAEYVLEIPATEHGKGKNATATVFLPTDMGFEEVGCGCETTLSGTVVIAVGRLYSVKVVIK